MYGKISFNIDRETLELAIRHCLFHGKTPSKQAIIDTVKAHVVTHGISITDCSEYWDGDLLSVDSAEGEKVTSALLV